MDWRYKSGRIGGHLPEVVWGSVWPAEVQGARTSALAVLHSAGVGTLLLLLPLLLDELAVAAAADGDGTEEPADDLVVEWVCSTILAPAFVGIGTFAQNAEARGPGNMAKGNQGARSMVGRSPCWW